MTGKLLKFSRMQGGRNLVLMVAVTLACSASFAEKPEWAGSGKGRKHEQKEYGSQPGFSKRDSLAWKAALGLPLRLGIFGHPAACRRQHGG